MAAESDTGEQEAIEAVLEEYEGLTFNEILELETLAFNSYSMEEWSVSSTQLEELEEQREDIISRMGFTNWEHAIERVEDYVYGELEPLIEIGLTKREEQALDDAEIAINEAILDLKCVEEFDPVLDDLFDALFTLEQLRNRAANHGHL